MIEIDHYHHHQLENILAEDHLTQVDMLDQFEYIVQYVLFVQ